MTPLDVLLVDPSEATESDLSQTLKNEGHRVHRCYTQDQADTAAFDATVARSRDELRTIVLYKIEPTALAAHIAPEDLGCRVSHDGAKLVVTLSGPSTEATAGTGYPRACRRRSTSPSRSAGRPLR